MRSTLFLFVSLVFAAVVFAQEVPLEAAAELGSPILTAAGMAINTAGVFLLVNLITSLAPTLRRRAPQWIPILALASGPLLNVAGAALSEALGHPVDFSPIIGAFGGSAAVVVHQVRTQRRRFRTKP